MSHPWEDASGPSSAFAFELSQTTLASLILACLCSIVSCFFTYTSGRALYHYIYGHRVTTRSTLAHDRGTDLVIRANLERSHKLQAMMMLQKNEQINMQQQDNQQHTMSKKPNIQSVSVVPPMGVLRPTFYSNARPSPRGGPLHRVALTLRIMWFATSLVALIGNVVGIFGVVVSVPPSPSPSHSLHHLPSSSSHPTARFCDFASKLGVLTYGLGKFSAFIFFVAKQRAVRPLAIWTRMEKVSLALTLAFLPFIIFAVIFTSGDQSELDGTCQLFVPPNIILTQVILDVFVSSIYLYLFIHPLYRTLTGNAIFRSSNTSNGIRVGGASAPMTSRIGQSSASSSFIARPTLAHILTADLGTMTIPRQSSSSPPNTATGTIPMPFPVATTHNTTQGTTAATATAPPACSSIITTPLASAPKPSPTQTEGATLGQQPTPMPLLSQLQPPCNEADVSASSVGVVPSGGGVILVDSDPAGPVAVGVDPSDSSPTRPATVTATPTLTLPTGTTSPRLTRRTASMELEKVSTATGALAGTMTLGGTRLSKMLQSSSSTATTNIAGSVAQPPPPPPPPSSFNVPFYSQRDVALIGLMRKNIRTYAMSLSMTVPCLMVLFLGLQLDEPHIRKLCFTVGTIELLCTSAALFYLMRRDQSASRSVGDASGLSRHPSNAGNGLGGVGGAGGGGGVSIGVHHHRRQHSDMSIMTGGLVGLRSVMVGGTGGGAVSRPGTAMGSLLNGTGIGTGSFLRGAPTPTRDRAARERPRHRTQQPSHSDLAFRLDGLFHSHRNGGGNGVESIGTQQAQPQQQQQQQQQVDSVNSDISTPPSSVFTIQLPQRFSSAVDDSNPTNVVNTHQPHSGILHSPALDRPRLLIGGRALRQASFDVTGVSPFQLSPRHSRQPSAATNSTGGGAAAVSIPTTPILGNFGRAPWLTDPMAAIGSSNSFSVGHHSAVTATGVGAAGPSNLTTGVCMLTPPPALRDRAMHMAPSVPVVPPIITNEQFRMDEEASEEPHMHVGATDGHRVNGMSLLIVTDTDVHHPDHHPAGSHSNRGSWPSTTLVGGSSLLPSQRSSFGHTQPSSILMTPIDLPTPHSPASQSNATAEMLMAPNACMASSATIASAIDITG